MKKGERQHAIVRGGRGMAVESGRRDIVLAGLESIIGSRTDHLQLRQRIRQSKENVFFMALEAAKAQLRQGEADPVIRKQLSKAKAGLKQTTDYNPFAEALKETLTAAIGDSVLEHAEEEKTYATGLLRELGDYVADDCRKIVRELSARQIEYRQFYEKLKCKSPNRFMDRERKTAMERAIGRVSSMLTWFEGTIGFLSNPAAQPTHKEDDDLYCTAKEAADILGISKKSILSGMSKHKVPLEKRGLTIQGREYRSGPQRKIRREFIEAIQADRLQRGSQTYRWTVYNEYKEVTNTAGETLEGITVTAEETKKKLPAPEEDSKNFYKPKEAAEILGMRTSALVSALRRYEKNLTEKGIIRRGKSCGPGLLWEVSKNYIDRLLADRTQRDLKRCRWNLFEIVEITRGAAGGTHLEDTASTAERNVPVGEERPERQTAAYSPRYYTTNEAAEMLGMSRGGLTLQLSKHEEALAKKGSIRRGGPCAQGFLWEISEDLINALRRQKEQGKTKYDWNLEKIAQTDTLASGSVSRTEQPTGAVSQTTIDSTRYYSTTEAARILRLTNSGLIWRLRKHENALLTAGDIRRGRVQSRGRLWEIKGSYLKTIMERAGTHWEQIREEATLVTAPPENAGTQTGRAPNKCYTLDEIAAMAGLGYHGIYKRFSRERKRLESSGAIVRRPGKKKKFGIFAEYVHLLLTKEERKGTTPEKAEDATVRESPQSTTGLLYTDDTAYIYGEWQPKVIYPNVHYSARQFVTHGISESDILERAEAKKEELDKIPRAVNILPKSAVGKHGPTKLFRGDQLLQIIPEDKRADLEERLQNTPANHDTPGIVRFHLEETPTRLYGEAYCAYGQVANIAGCSIGTIAKNVARNREILCSARGAKVRLDAGSVVRNELAGIRADHVKYVVPKKCIPQIEALLVMTRDEEPALQEPEGHPIPEGGTEEYCSIEEAMKILGMSQGGVQSNISRHRAYLVEHDLIRPNKPHGQKRKWNIQKQYLEELVKQKGSEDTERYRWVPEQQRAPHPGRQYPQDEQYFTIRDAAKALGMSVKQFRKGFERNAERLHEKCIIKKDESAGPTAPWWIRKDFIQQMIDYRKLCGIATYRWNVDVVMQQAAQGGLEGVVSTTGTERQAPPQEEAGDGLYYKPSVAARILGITTSGLLVSLRKNETELAKRGIIERGEACARGFRWKVRKDYIDRLLADRTQRGVSGCRWTLYDADGRTESTVEETHRGEISTPTRDYSTGRQPTERQAPEALTAQPGEERTYTTIAAARYLQEKTGKDQRAIMDLLKSSKDSEQYRHLVKVHPITRAVEYPSSMIQALRMQLST